MFQQTKTLNAKNAKTRIKSCVIFHCLFFLLCWNRKWKAIAIHTTRLHSSIFNEYAYNKLLIQQQQGKVKVENWRALKEENYPIPRTKQKDCITLHETSATLWETRYSYRFSLLFWRSGVTRAYLTNSLALNSSSSLLSIIDLLTFLFSSSKKRCSNYANWNVTQLIILTVPDKNFISNGIALFRGPDKGIGISGQPIFITPDLV